MQHCPIAYLLHNLPWTALWGWILMPWLLTADWRLIQQWRQQLIDQHLIVANCCHFPHNCHVEDNVLKLEYKPDKLGSCGNGTHRVEAMHTNGTITIWLSPHTIEQLSIWHVKPCKSMVWTTWGFHPVHKVSLSSVPLCCWFATGFCNPLQRGRMQHSTVFPHPFHKMNFPRHKCDKMPLFVGSAFCKIKEGQEKCKVILADTILTMSF